MKIETEKKEQETKKRLVSRHHKMKSNYDDKKVDTGQKIPYIWQIWKLTERMSLSSTEVIEHEEPVASGRIIPEETQTSAG